MKKSLLTFLSFLFISVFALAQGHTTDINHVETTPPENRTSALQFVLPDNGGTSANARAPQGATRYIRTAYLITPAEMTASGLAAGKVINAIGFNYSSAQNIATTDTFKVYLQNTTDATYSKASTAWSNGSNGIIDNMTLASDGSITIPAAAGIFDYTFSAGSTFTYTGGGVYIAYEYQNAAGTIATTANVALCNTALTDGLRNTFSATSLGTDLTTASAFRPATRLGFAVANDGTVTDVYTLGKIPLVYSAPHVITAKITNSGDNAITNRNVTLSITGANTFSNVKTITTLAPGATTLVSFDGFTPTTAGTNTVTVTLPADDNATNNTKAYTQIVTNNVFSYTDNTASVPGSVGYNTGSGLLLNKYHINGSSFVNAVNVSIGAASTTTPAGKTVYAVVLDGTGAIIGQSANYVITAADLGAFKSFAITTPPSVTNTDFFVGLAQTADAAGYFPVGYQLEAIPTRSGAYYSAPLTGVVTTEVTTIGRLLIEAVVNAAVPLNFLKFNAAYVSKDVKLNWSTANEINTSYFAIERSADGSNYEKTGTVTAGTTIQSGVNTYEFTDANASALNQPVLYYRLKQVDKDGKYTYSSTVSVKNTQIKPLAFNAVNVAGGTIQINLYLTKPSAVTAIITNMSGQVVYTKKFQGSEGNSIVTPADLDLHKGQAYVVSLFSGVEKQSQTIIIP